MRREAARNVRGQVLDVSGSGQTLFIEPEAVASLRDEIDALKVDEANEEIRMNRKVAMQAYEEELARR